MVRVAARERHSDWRDRAVCTDRSPELFFPTGDTGPALVQTAEAISVCNTCPVRSPCLAWALANNAEGVWGGTGEATRRVMIRNSRTIRT